MDAQLVVSRKVRVARLPSLVPYVTMSWPVLVVSCCSLHSFALAFLLHASVAVSLLCLVRSFPSCP